MMADDMAGVLVHPWLGELRRYHDDELCAERISRALTRLAAIEQFTVEHAPPGRAQQYAPDTRTRSGPLFLTGVEAGTGDH